MPERDICLDGSVGSKSPLQDIVRRVRNRRPRCLTRRCAHAPTDMSCRVCQTPAASCKAPALSASRRPGFPSPWASERRRHHSRCRERHHWTMPLVSWACPPGPVPVAADRQSPLVCSVCRVAIQSGGIEKAIQQRQHILACRLSPLAAAPNGLTALRRQHHISQLQSLH